MGGGTQVLTYMADTGGEAHKPSCVSANTPVGRGSRANFFLNELITALRFVY